MSAVQIEDAPGVIDPTNPPNGPAQSPVGFQDCPTPANPVVAENCLPGTTDWQIDNFFQDIEGFASETSLKPGETIDFFVNTKAGDSIF